MRRGTLVLSRTGAAREGAPPERLAVDRRGEDHRGALGLDAELGAKDFVHARVGRAHEAAGRPGGRADTRRREGSEGTSGARGTQKAWNPGPAPPFSPGTSLRIRLILSTLETPPGWTRSWGHGWGCQGLREPERGCPSRVARRTPGAGVELALALGLAATDQTSAAHRARRARRAHHARAAPGPSRAQVPALSPLRAWTRPAAARTRPDGYHPRGQMNRLAMARPTSPAETAPTLQIAFAPQAPRPSPAATAAPEPETTVISRPSDANRPGGL